MASIIRIKRSGQTAVPPSLASGELAYSWEGSTGGKLYIGWGDENTTDTADFISAIGGQYYTDKLNHTPGLLTANAAIITAADGSIDQLKVGNFEFSSNILSTISDNDINIIPDSGIINVGGSRIQNIEAPTDGGDAVNKIYLDTRTLGIAADVGTADDVLLTSGTITFSGNTGITTTVSDNSIDIDLNDTAVTPGAYGSTTQIPLFTVDQQGRLTFASTANISTTLYVEADIGGVNGGIDLLDDVLKIHGGVGVTTTIVNDTVTIDLAQDISTSSDVRFNDVTVDGILYSNDITSENITVAGNLVVQGTTTTVNTEEINLADNIILLNSNLDANTAPVQSSGLSINRGSSADVSLLWDEGNDRWTVGAYDMVANQFIGTINGGSY